MGAGYVLYGSVIMIVFFIGNGVNGFMLDLVSIKCSGVLLFYFNFGVENVVNFVIKEKNFFWKKEMVILF